MKKRLKQFKAWVIKHKEANHPICRGLYDNKRDADDDYEDMPEYDYNDCGKRDDYEIIEVIVKQKR